jgi:serine/threonine protein kinase
MSVYISLARQFHSFSDISTFLQGAEGKVVGNLATIVGSDSVPFHEIVSTINALAKKRFQLSESEIDASLHAIAEMRRCAQEIDRNAPRYCFCIKNNRFSRLESQLNIPEIQLEFVKQIYHHLKENQQKYRQQVQKSGKSLYIQPKESGLSRAFHIDSAGRTIIHLNRKKRGDLSFNPGSEKNVKLAVDLGTAKIYATAGYKIVNPNEFNYLQAFKGIPGFVQLVDHFKYDKNGKEKYRAIFDYCNGGELFDAVVDDRLSAQDRKTIFIELIQNLALMHRLGYLHRDFKMENILLHREGEGPLKPVISDFGSVCKQDDLVSRRKIHLITARATSPEYVKALRAPLEEQAQKLLQANTVALDSWALGCILCLVLKMKKLPAWMLQNGVDRMASVAEIHGNWLPEPAKKNSPEHLVWELLQNRLPVTEAEPKLSEIDWSG